MCLFYLMWVIFLNEGYLACSSVADTCNYIRPFTDAGFHENILSVGLLSFPGSQYAQLIIYLSIVEISLERCFTLRWGWREAFQQKPEMQLHRFYTKQFISVFCFSSLWTQKILVTLEQNAALRSLASGPDFTKSH